MIAVSVISRHSWLDSSREPASTSATAVRNPGSLSWAADTFTDIDGRRAGPSDHSSACRTASSSTCAPSTPISPVRSATGMNSDGGITRPDRSVQRHSASRPATLPSDRLTIGW